MSKSKNVFSLSILAAAVLGLPGCATNGMKAVENDNANQHAASGEVFEKAYVKVQKNPMISKAQSFWVDKTPLPPKVDATSQLPAFFATTLDVNLQVARPLAEVLASISNHPKLPHPKFTVAQDVYEADSSKLATNLSSLNSTANVDSTAAKPGAMAGSGTSGASQSGGGAGRRVDVMVSDLIMRDATFADILDTIATKTNLSWAYDGDKIHFTRYETRIFRIEALAGNLSMNSTISSNGSGSTGDSGGTNVGSTSTSSTTLKTASDLWTDVSNAIQAQLSPRGKLSLMPSTGQVTITDTPDNLRRISRYFNDLNSNLGKVVAFNVNVYSVERSLSDGYGIDWNAVWSTVASKYSLGYSTSGNVTGLGNQFSVNLINAANGDPNAFAGSKAVIAALSSLGKASLVTSTSSVTLNNIPVPLSVATETGYLKKMSTTVSGTSGTTQTSMEPGTVTSGFNMSLLPRVGDGNDLLVQFSMDLSDVVKISTYVSPDNKSSIQLPQKNLRNFLQRVSMRSGETLILSGFQQVQAQDAQSGIGDPKFWELGGSKNTSGKTTTLVIMITPYVMAK